MSYAELWQASEAIAALVERSAAEGSGPVIVYGNKDPLMVASFLGCMKAGHWIKDEDLCYILFTSGSTGTLKGVEVTAACFDMNSVNKIIDRVAECL